MISSFHVSYTWLRSWLHSDTRDKLSATCSSSCRRRSVHFSRLLLALVGACTHLRLQRVCLAAHFTVPGSTPTSSVAERHARHWPMTWESRSLDTAVSSAAVLACSVPASGSRPVASGTVRAERAGSLHRTSYPFWHHPGRFMCLPRRHRNFVNNHWNTSLESSPLMYATPLPVRSEMLFTHWSAAFCSPEQHELASSTEGFTLVRDQSVISLLVGRLRGRWRNHLWTRKLWNDRLHRSSQHADALDLGINALLLVPVGPPKH